jgi:hypothetical protein
MGIRSIAKILVAAGILAAASMAVPAAEPNAAEPNEAADRKVVDDFWATWSKPEMDAEALASFFREDGVFRMESLGKPAPIVGRAAIAAFFKECCAKGTLFKIMVHETLVRGPFVMVSYDDFPLVPKDPALAKAVRARHPDMFDGEKPLMNSKMVALFWIKDGKILECISSTGGVEPLRAGYSNVLQ